MKKIKYLLFSFFIVIFGMTGVKADKTYSIDVTMEIDAKGNAKVVEKWDFRADDGTEIYKPIGELGHSEITNFEAYMDDTLFTYEKHWDIDASFSKKAYKNGINETDDGIELCIGKSEYGRHIYTFSYEVSNVIYNVEDAQVLYWKFINDNMKNAPEKFSVIVKGPSAYSDDLPVWGYGYLNGYAYVYDGQIEMVKESNFKSSEYAVLLVQYPLGTFDTNNSWYKFSTFDDVLHLATTGSFKMTLLDKIIVIAAVIFGAFIFGLVMVAIYAASKDNTYLFNKINMRDVNNFRDIPCDKDILSAYLLSKVYSLYKKKEDLFGAVLLKWVLDGTVTIKEEEKESLLGSKTTTSIDMTKEYNDDTPIGALYQMMKKASVDGILESKELSKWATNNYSKLYKWFDDVEKYARDKYIEKGMIEKVTGGKLVHYSQFKITDKLEEEATYLAGLKKFLKYFSEIDKKQPIEVTMWEQYLIYAQIFGMAKQVAKTFKDLYPEVVKDMELTGVDYVSIVRLNDLTTRTVSAASTAKTRAESYSSGGGGGSFGGGGGGSFGGGSGGGGR